jgi:putative membrane protein
MAKDEHMGEAEKEHAM